MTADKYCIDETILKQVARDLGLSNSEVVRYALMELGMLHDKFNRKRGSSAVELRHVPITHERAKALLEHAQRKVKNLSGDSQQSLFGQGGDC